MGNLISKIVSLGKRNFDVKSLFGLTQTSIPHIQEMGMKALVSMSENKEENKNN
jgi:hypothetical protein